VTIFIKVFAGIKPLRHAPSRIASEKLIHVRESSHFSRDELLADRGARIARERTTRHNPLGALRLTLVLALGTINSFANTGATPPGIVAKQVFTWLMSTAFVLSCAACALTADTLSGESREPGLIPNVRIKFFLLWAPKCTKNIL
jgi:hypothetical protein